MAGQYIVAGWNTKSMRGWKVYREFIAVASKQSFEADHVFHLSTAI